MPAGRPRRRSRRWIGFFLVLAVLGAAAILIPIVYNLSIQLRPEQVADARLRWQKHAPANYDLEYLVKMSNAEGEEESQYRVKVRAARTVLVVKDEEILFADPSLAAVAGAGALALSCNDPQHYSVAALLDEVEGGLERDPQTGKRICYATAQFDAKDGHPYHYVRRRLGTKERAEWNIKLTRIE